MSYQIKFKDGSVLVSYDTETFTTPFDLSALYPNSVFVIRSDDYTTPNFTKEDYDGHIWTWNGTGITVTGLPNNAFNKNVSNNQILLLNVIGGDDNIRGLNPFNANVYYSNTHQWRGVNGVANGVSIASFMSQYSDYYDCINYARNGTTQIEIHETRTSPSQKQVWGTYGGGGFNLNWFTTNFPNSWSEYTPEPDSTDPYLPPDGPDEPSEPGGGEGDRDDVDVPVPIPGLPPISAADTGFVTLFNPSSAQIKSLANYMWSSGFDIATFKNIVANPMECILGLSIIPFTPSHAGQGSVKVGNIDTQLFFPIVDNQFVEIDCGTIQVAEYWGSYLDYSPYTKISLYLPYIGIVPLDIDEVQGKSLTVKYHVDVLSGACIAYLLCGTSVLYSYIGQCSCNVPITSNDFTNTVNGVLGIAGNIGSLVALGGSSAPMATGTAIKTAASMASNAINMLKPNVQKSGAMAGTGGLMGTQYPYIIKQRPRQSVPTNQNTFKGYPSNIAVKLGDLSGYTEVDEVHLDGIPATDAEMNEILQLLSEGVYI